MYKCLKNVLVSSSALLLAVSLGAGLNDVNVNARRVHSHRVIHYKHHKSNRYMNEYRKGEQVGKKVFISNDPLESGSTLVFGDGVYNFKNVLYQHHVNRKFINGVYKKLSIYKHKKDSKDFYKTSIKEVRQDVNADRRILKHFHNPSRVTKLAIDSALDSDMDGNAKVYKFFMHHHHNRNIRNTWVRVDKFINHDSDASSNWKTEF